MLKSSNLILNHINVKKKLKITRKTFAFRAIIFDS